MTIKDSDFPSSAPAARIKTKRFRNWKLIGVEFIAVSFGIYAFLAWAPRLPGYAGLLVALLRKFGGLPSVLERYLSRAAGSRVSQSCRFVDD
jgi:hypothetical protein